MKTIGLVAVTMMLVGCGASDESGGPVTDCKLGTLTGAYLQVMDLKSGSIGCPKHLESVVNFGSTSSDPACTGTETTDSNACTVTVHSVCPDSETTGIVRQTDNSGDHLTATLTVQISGCYGTYTATYDRL